MYWEHIGFGTDEQFSVAVAHDFLKKIVFHTGPLDWIDLEQLEKNSLKNNKKIWHNDLLISICEECSWFLTNVVNSGNLM